MKGEWSMMKRGLSYGDPRRHLHFLVHPGRKYVRMVAIFLCILSSVLRAQNPVTRASGPIPWPKPMGSTTPWTAAGKEFYACFPSVVGSSSSVDQNIRTLFISSRAPARVTVEVLKTALDTTFIVTPGRAARVEIPIYDALNRNDYEVAVSKVVHIFSNEVIAVYGFSHDYLSSDGFIVYPTQTLGTAYMVMSTRNAVNYNIFGDTIIAQQDTTAPNPRSECAIVATRNNTHVTFTLTATSYSGRFIEDSTYTIQLDRGQVYPIMARDTGTRLTGPLTDNALDWWNLYAPWKGGPDCDLTGSYITSDKPIAVFSGHERAAAPFDLEYNYGDVSRDHLIEQVPPISAWGKRYIVVNAGQDRASARASGGDAVRILSAFDNTHVKINGVQTYTLGRGEHCDFLSGSASLIESDVPILVAHFMQSQTAGYDDMGDPDLTMARPIEDFANEYTLPPWHDALTFTEPHLLVICDTSAQNSTRYNGMLLPAVPWKPIAGTSFATGIFPVNYNFEQRLESTLPCYAEFFAYGNKDSYCYAGGGDYPYVDSLFAADLNFDAIPVGQAGNKASPLHTSNTGRDTVHVYNYEWVSGDTSNFILTGGMNQSASIAPLGKFPVPFQFHPIAPRKYNALLRVWSDAVNPVFIRLQGNGIAPRLTVIPDTINFGRVRIGAKRDSSFLIENTGTTTIELTDLAYENSLFSTPDFTADTVKSSLPTLHLYPSFNSTISDTVHFHPTKLGAQIAQIPIYWTDSATGNTNDTPDVVLLGVGVEPSIASTGYDFGSLRVDSLSTLRTITIANLGSDATAIDSVTIVDSTALKDFIVDLDTLPPTGPRKLPIILGYEGADTSVSFTVRFQPHSLGEKLLIVRIQTADMGVIYDTLQGRGVEPLVLVTPDTIDFGTFVISQSTNSILPKDTTFTVSNLGTLDGKLDSLLYHDTTHFAVSLIQPSPSLNTVLDTGASLTGHVRFNVIEEGDFLDSVVLMNDTRYTLYQPYRNYHPKIILKAKVRTGPIGPDTLEFGTIANCNPDTSVVIIYNPYPVEVHIDSIALLSDTAGFSLPNDFIHQISIPPDSEYPLRIIYSFPPDSLNGPQVLKMGLFQRRLDGEPPVVDTVTASLMRKQRVFTLHAHLPSFISSANDVSDLKLPITVQGPRSGVTELNSWTLSLRFSNDLFEPVGIDTTGALAVRGDSTFTMTTHWDQATRTYTIVVTGSSVSDSAKIANDLLLSILMRAYLTTDTVVTVTPTFTWASHPCAYNLQSFTLSIPYADDCGDPTIRAFMRRDHPFFTLIGIWPNPVDHTGGVTISYNASQASEVTSQVFSESGEEIGRAKTSVAAGAGTIALDPALFAHSGAAFIRVEAAPIGGGAAMVKMVKIEIAH